MSNKLRGIFLNTEKAICSIYESGKMCYNCLVQSTNYSLDYVELSSKNREISLDYDFYIFNYHWVTMGWLDTKFIKSLSGFKATIVIEMSQDSPFDCVSKDAFDAYLVLDPTCMHSQSNVYAFPRPLEIGLNPITVYKDKKIPVIGTFGLSYPDKGFDEVVRAVDKEFSKAIIKINVPNSEHSRPLDAKNFKTLLSRLELKNDIKVEMTNYYFSKEELINWCAQNTLNVFLYNRRVGNGLSATTDQAIASSRPLSISTNPTFRHIHTYIKPYPYMSLKESIKTTIPLVKKIQRDWSPYNFILLFEEVLKENHVRHFDKIGNQKIKLPVVENSILGMSKMFAKQDIIDFVPPVFIKIYNGLKQVFKKNHEDGEEISILLPYVHQMLQSNSQSQEDLLIDLLMNKKRNGVYVDVGVGNPFFNNNTLRFYLRGWKGINIEPSDSDFKKIAKNRKYDINLNVAISGRSGKVRFYQIGRDSSLSTLNRKIAIRYAETNKLQLTSSIVETIPISKVFDLYLNNKHVDFLSVNTNGSSLEVLESNNWDEYRPTLVLVESSVFPRRVIKFMDRQNYLYIFSNHINALFVDKTTSDKNMLTNFSWNTLRV